MEQDWRSPYKETYILEWLCLTKILCIYNEWVDKKMEMYLYAWITRHYLKKAKLQNKNTHLLDIPVIKQNTTKIG